MNDDTLDTGVETPAVADTVETPTVEANVQVEQVTPEAAQSTEETSSEITAADTVEERLYAGKYKTAEEMEKAYTNLQSKATRDAQEKAELARILNEAFVTPDAPTQVATDTDNFDYEEPASNVDPRIEKIERKSAVQDFIFAHPDADGEAINKVLAEDQFISQISGYEAKLEYAYLKSKNMTSSKAVEEAKRQTATETQVKIAEKQAAQVETVRTQAQPAGNNELSPSELRSTLRDDKAFDELIQKRFPGVSKMRSR